jgi:hypothetical protein
MDRNGEVLIRDSRPSRRWKPALHSGAEVEPFHVRWRGKSLYVPDDHELLRKVYKSGFDLSRYAKPKILLRQTGDRMVAARDEKGLLCLNNVHLLCPREDPRIDLRFLCGLLLSDSIQRYYQAIALEAGRPLAQVDLATVQTLPFPCDQAGKPYGVELSSKEEVRLVAKVAKALVDRTTPGWSHGITGILQDAVGAGEATLADHGDVSGANLAAGMICRLVEILEGEIPPARAQEISDLLDKAIRILFGLAPEAAPQTVGASARG